MLGDRRELAKVNRRVEGDEDGALGIGDTGRERILARSEKLLLCADIRLDNAAELAAARGMRPGADTAALLLDAWECLGARTLDRLVGDFALIVFDRLERRLFLARDPTGQRPLFFARDGDLCLAASTPSALRALLPASDCDAGAVARQLAGTGLKPGQSWFEGVGRVNPGELVIIEGDAVRRHRWWDPSLDQRSGSTEAFAEELRGLLDSAVGCRIAGAAEPVVTHLSSGLDSSAVTATAAGLIGGERMLAFTSAPLTGEVGPLIRGRTADETRAATATAGLLGIPHRIVRDTPPLFDVLRRQTKLAESPLHPFNLTWWSEIRSQARAAGADTVLIGALGNFTLSAGGLWALPDYLRAGRFGAWLREARAAARRPDTRWRGVLFNSFTPWLPAPLWHALRRQFLGLPAPGSLSFLRPEWRARAVDPDAITLPSSDQARNRLGSILGDDPGMIRAAAIADCGVAELDPTADRRLIEFSLRLPPEQLFRDGRSRPLVRTAFRGRLPSAILDAPLRGLQSADWFLRLTQQSARDMADNIAAEPLVAELIDLAALKQAIDQWPTGDWNRPETVAKYCFAVPNALSVGVFVQECGRISPAGRTLP